MLRYLTYPKLNCNFNDEYLVGIRRNHPEAFKGAEKHMLEENEKTCLFLHDKKTHEIASWYLIFHILQIIGLTG